MLSKKVGDQCPKCEARLIRRKSTFRLIPGDVAYCAPCNAAYELAEDYCEAHPTVFAAALA